MKTNMLKDITIIILSAMLFFVIVIEIPFGLVGGLFFGKNITVTAIPVIAYEFVEGSGNYSTLKEKIETGTITGSYSISEGKQEGHDYHQQQSYNTYKNPAVNVVTSILNGYEFVGWYTDFNIKYSSDYSYIQNLSFFRDNINLYAYYVAID